MKQQGISGALVFQAGEAKTPAWVPFLSDQWRSLFKLAVDEAAKRGITIGLNLCDGWNAGGPWIDAEHAAKKLVHQSATYAATAGLPLTFAPRQSWFVVFRRDWRRTSAPRQKRPNHRVLETVSELKGPWTVRFDPAWGGPGAVDFKQLDDWTKCPEEGIRYYSGTATYEKTFGRPDSNRPTKRYDPSDIFSTAAHVPKRVAPAWVAWANGASPRAQIARAVSRTMHGQTPRTLLALTPSIRSTNKFGT